MKRRARHPCPDFAGLVPATRGLIAAPWTPASLSLFRGTIVMSRRWHPSRPTSGHRFFLSSRASP
jgi:hypothetical protein